MMPYATKRRRRPEDPPALHDRRRRLGQRPALLAGNFLNLKGLLSTIFRIEFIGSLAQQDCTIDSISIACAANNDASPIADDYYLLQVQAGQVGQDRIVQIAWTYVQDPYPQSGIIQGNIYFQRGWALPNGHWDDTSYVHDPDHELIQFSNTADFDPTALQGMLDRLWGPGNASMALHTKSTNPDTPGYIWTYVWYITITGDIDDSYLMTSHQGDGSNFFTSHGTTLYSVVEIPYDPPANNALIQAGQQPLNAVYKIGPLGVIDPAGTMTINWTTPSGSGSTVVPVMITAADLQALLEAETNIGSGNVLVTEEGWRTGTTTSYAGHYATESGQYHLDAGISGFGSMSASMAVWGHNDFWGSIDGVGSFDATLSRDLSLAGAFAGTSMLTAVSLNSIFHMTGSIDGLGNFSGDYFDRQQSIAGSIDGFGNTFSIMTNDPHLIGSIDGVGSFDATISLPIRSFVGSFGGTSSFSSALDAGTGFAGSLNGIGSMAALTSVDVGLTGEIDGASALDGMTSLSIEMIGSMDGVTSLASSLYVIRQIAGSVDGTSVWNGALSPTRRLAGTIDGVSAISGTPSLVVAVTGSFSGSSAVDTASISATRGLIGSMDGTGNLANGLSLDRMPLLAGAFNGVGDASGPLHTKIRMGGSFSGGSSFADAAIDSQTGFEGSIDGVSSAAGTQLRRTVEFAGSFGSVGNLVLIPGIDLAQSLAGSFSGASELVGNLAWRQKLAGAFGGSSSMDATLTRDPYLIGSIDGYSSATAAVYVDRILAGALSGMGSLQASLDTQAALSGELAGVSSFDGSLNGGWGLLGSIDGTSSWIGSGMSTGHRIELAGSVDGNSDLAGASYVARSMVGRMDGSSSFQAVAYVDWSLSGSIVGSGSFSASLGTILTHGPYVVEAVDLYSSGQQESASYQAAGAEEVDFSPIEKSELIDGL